MNGQARNAKFGSVGAGDFVLRVKEQPEWQGVPANKAAMALNAVAAAAQDGAAGALVVLGAVAKAACFPGTPRGPIPGAELENQGLASVVGQTRRHHLLPDGHLALEAGSLAALVKHRWGERGARRNRAAGAVERQARRLDLPP